MPNESTAFLSAALVSIGALLFITGGLRFRRWAIEDRSGIPRFSASVETILLWLLYSGVISVLIVVVRQSLRSF